MIRLGRSHRSDRLAKLREAEPSGRSAVADRLGCFLGFALGSRTLRRGQDHPEAPRSQPKEDGAGAEQVRYFGRR